MKPFQPYAALDRILNQKPNCGACNGTGIVIHETKAEWFWSLGGRVCMECFGFGISLKPQPNTERGEG